MIYHQAGNRNNPNQIIQMLMQPPYRFFPDTITIITSAVRCGKLYECAWVLIRLRRQLKANYNDLNGLLINVWLVD